MYPGMAPEAILTLLPPFIPQAPEGWQLGWGLNVQRKGTFILVPMSRGEGGVCLNLGASRGERSSCGGTLPVGACAHLPPNLLGEWVPLLVGLQGPHA